MMPPSSWKVEIQKAIEEAANADREQREAKYNDAAANIASAIQSLGDAQKSQIDHEDRHEKINITLAVITIFLVLLTVIFTGLSWWVFHGQLNEMQAEQRPWVYATNVEPAGRIVFERGLYVLQLKFSIKNTGHLPAFYVLPKTAAIVVKVGVTSTKVIRNQVCDDYRKNPLADSAGDTVFADQVVTHGGFTSEDYPTVSKESWDALQSDRIIVMFGCIDYQFPDQPGHHQSRFAFAVGQRKDQGVLQRINMLPDDPTSVDIRLLPITIDAGIPAD